MQLPARGREPADIPLELTWPHRPAPTRRLVKFTLQTSNRVFYLQLPPLKLDQLEIVYRWMLAHLRQFSFQHPMPLFEFSKLKYGHMANLLFIRLPKLDTLPYLGVQVDGVRCA